MFRRSYVCAIQRTATAYAAAAAKAAPKAAAAAKPAATKTAAKGPEMTAAHGATGPASDSVVDKALLLCGVSLVVWWWVAVPGPKNQH